MKKLFTLLASLLAVVSLNAATVEWIPGNEGFEKNHPFEDEEIVINPNITIHFATGESVNTQTNEPQPPIYRDVTSMNGNKGIGFYSKNVMTIKADNAIISKVSFQVYINPDPDVKDNDSTPNWKITAKDSQGKSTTLDSKTNTWEGTTDELVITGGSKSTFTSITIEYISTDPSQYKEANLFFTEDMVTKDGEVAQNVILENNGVTVTFTSNSDDAKIDPSNGYYGTADEYITLPYRYRTGGKSSNGVNSGNKGVFNFPCAGTLYIYAYNNQTSDTQPTRRIQIIQNDKQLFEYAYGPNDGVPATDRNTRTVYPVRTVDVEAGTAYYLWPDNQLMLHGFMFEPKQEEKIGDTLYIHFVDQAGENYIATNNESLQGDAQGAPFYSFEIVEFHPAAYEDQGAIHYFFLSDKDPKIAESKEDENENLIPIKKPIDDLSIFGNVYHVAAKPETPDTEVQNINLFAGDNDTTNISIEKYNGEDSLRPISIESGWQYAMTADLTNGTLTVNKGNESTGIYDVEAPKTTDGRMYNLFGMPVGDDYKGIVIKDGKKYILK